MNRFLVAALLVLPIACSRKQEAAPSSTAPSSASSSPSASATAPSESTYPMTATIVARDATKNTINLDNQEVPGRMAAMKMDYELRGAKVTSLPPDGASVEVTMHDRDGAYYVTDVKAKK